MKNLIIPVLMVFGLASCNKDHLDNSCIDDGLLNDEALCNGVYQPVCGCDGNTYSNACTAKFHHGLKYFTTGACGTCKYATEGEVVDYTGLDGCGMVIKLKNGDILEPNELPQDFSLTAGSIVEFDFVAAEEGSSCMAGEVVNILCIREAGCLPITYSHGFGFDAAVSIDSASISGDCLQVHFSHGGGCENHEYKLNLLPFCGTPPEGPVQLEFVHEDNGDLCEALLMKSLSYDLTSLQDSSTGSVEFYLQDREQTYSQKFMYSY